MKSALRNILCTAPLLALLAACGGEQVEAPPPPVRPVKLFVVEGTGGAAIRQFPGSISASQRAELSFRVNGVLQKILVREGETVARDQVLAELDPTDFEIQLSDRQATYDSQRKNFERAKELIEDGNISRTDYDRVEANFRTAEAALKLAQQELAYTRLKAPFAGSIGRRYVENFEEVQAKQPIFQVQNLGQLDVTIDVPENLVRSLRRGRDQQSGGDAAQGAGVLATASFDGQSEEFELEFKEVATRADSTTQTFRVTFTMPQPEGFNVLPGMTADVQLDLTRAIDTDSAKWVPTSAVVADSDLDARVWVLDGDSMTVSAKPVKIGRMSGRRIEVTDGLEGGEEIVSVGAAYLSDGMEVSRMALSEQAEPRAEDPS